MLIGLETKISVVALSAAEAEYIALSSATQEVVRLRRFLEKLGVQMEKPTIIMEDNSRNNCYCLESGQ
jgi:hypothetical protein